MDTPFLRARSAEEKGERRAHLLATAKAALDEGTPLAELSLNALARRAGMAKANVYRYFASREALLLALLWAEWAPIEAALCGPPPAPAAPMGPDQLAARLSRLLTDAPLLCALITALPSVLEQNLSAEAVAQFKRQTLVSMGAVGAALHTACPALSAEAHGRLLHDALAVVAGLYPFAHPAPAAAAAMADPALAPLRRDFEADLRRFLRALAAQAAAEGPA
ncbi:MAG: TetR family transcriptional regulator [Deltaproteobacteria bacterium]|jgi:AcrR family transcriptional regulator|nr:TetR family transcriptional regulator [Deltaproteobacteria bacterium]